ncbi:CHAT domain-containing protein [Ornithinimicrobium murale]|uniref:CHAT domain-containing protein n=1 Tax=Ornithinimicrobium murale TaxID=1050153 RepID=UPI000E0D8150|nr:CHAT domain-containing protein [Ornithinimicrobium murale]
MTRVVFSVVEMPGPDGVRLGIQLKEPPELPRPQPEPLGLEAHDAVFQALHGPPTQDAVRRAGRLLFDALLRNAPLAKQLSAALLVQPPQRRPVCVELATTDGESFPWEALCDTDGAFLGLDERWAVGRIVETVIPLEGYRHFVPPLRVAAILSCLGVPAAAEWEALRAAVQDSTLPAEVLVLVSEDALHADISATAPDWVSVEFVPSTVAELGARLQEFNAHVLHLFCHGLSTRTSPHLQVATRADWLTGQSSSLLLESGDIGDFHRPADSLPWLVVLNSCETASATGEQSAGSVALNLVYTEGIPAVVGMREPVQADDATRFTEAFYGELLREFASLPTTPGVAAPVDWARLLVGAREQLAERYEPLKEQRGTRKAWTLPVVYTRPAVFTVQVGEATSPGSGELDAETTRALVLSIEALTGLRAQISGTGDSTLLAYIDDDLGRLRAELETR